MSHKLWDLESQCHSNIEFPPCQWPKCKKKFHIAEAAVLVVEKNYSKTLYKTFQPASHFWEKVSTTGAPENLTIYFRSDDKIYLSRSWKYIDLNLMSFFANDVYVSIFCVSVFISKSLQRVPIEGKGRYTSGCYIGCFIQKENVFSVKLEGSPGKCYCR